MSTGAQGDMVLMYACGCPDMPAGAHPVYRRLVMLLHPLLEHERGVTPYVRIWAPMHPMWRDMAERDERVKSDGDREEQED